jgi:site-specific DNA recombinase
LLCRCYPKSKRPVPTSTIHKILRNRIYCGDFDFDGKTYPGKYEAIISRDMWEQVQDVANGRNKRKPHVVRRDFAFSNLIRCGHCGCALVGELKKKQYVYYHCTGYKGKCPEPYTREEVLDACFSKLLRSITFPKEVLEWIIKALRESHADEKTFHDDAILRLQVEYRRLQNRIDAMYLDKLDGRIDGDFFDARSAEWRSEQDRLLRDVGSHQTANETYIEEGVQILRLAQRASGLFDRQETGEKKRLLGFLLSNCVWKDGTLTAEFRQPFDTLALTCKASIDDTGGDAGKSGSFDIWLPIVDSNSAERPFGSCPEPVAVQIDTKAPTSETVFPLSKKATSSGAPCPRQRDRVNAERSDAVRVVLTPHI